MFGLLGSTAIASPRPSSLPNGELSFVNGRAPPVSLRMSPPSSGVPAFITGEPAAPPVPGITAGASSRSADRLVLIAVKVAPESVERYMPSMLPA
jgi:hypothetical protein